jgi:hypothetical protein
MFSARRSYVDELYCRIRRTNCEPFCYEGKSLSFFFPPPSNAALVTLQVYFQSLIQSSLFLRLKPFVNCASIFLVSQREAREPSFLSAI